MWANSRAAAAGVSQSEPDLDARKRVPKALKDEEFKALVQIAHTHTGIALDGSKRPMLHARLSRRMAALALSDFGDYIALLSAPSSTELTHFKNRVTTNLTYFHREPKHFSFLTQNALPALAKIRPDGERLRIWSAGCSTGQEPYSLAMTLCSVLPRLAPDPRILCTDLNTDAVNFAERGIYAADDLNSLSHEQKVRWFRAVDSDGYEVSEVLRSMLVFKTLNLFERWPIRKEIDVIFCRNVLIYFEPQAQQALVERFTGHLRPGGYLFLGHSESLPTGWSTLKRVGATVYQRP